jgi:UTP--glucose-1-phosphate uridylyltransferase
MIKNKLVKKIIIPIAGLGTRMLPATKAIPKEMLPIVDKPIIQYIVEEAVEAGFEEIILVTHSSKSAVENHFDTSFELEAALDKRVKRSLLKEIKAISSINILIHSVRQGEAKGLGHAIYCAKSIVGDDPFAVTLPDMLIQGGNKRNNISMMKKQFDSKGVSSVLLGKAKKLDVSKYGIAKVKKIKGLFGGGIIEEIIEKPSLKKAPSNLFAAGRYVFNNRMMFYLSKLRPDRDGEIQLTEAIDIYIKKEKALMGFILEGKLHDCGDKLGYLKANVEYAKEDRAISKEFKAFLREI